MMNSQQALLQHLTAGLTDPANQVLLQSIFGTADLETLAQAVAEVRQAHLEQTIEAYEFWEGSVSFTVGLRLENT